MTDKMQHIIIGTLSSSDWQKFKDIRLEALSEEPQAFSSTFSDALKYPDDYWKERLENKDQMILFAKDGDRVIGLVSIHIKHEGVDEDTAIFSSVYVNKSYRGMGIGKMLFLDAFERLRNHKHITTANLWVLETEKRTVGFYKGLGFVEVGKKEDALETETGYIDELIMEKEL